MPIVFMINIATNHPLLSLFADFQSASPFQKRDQARTIAKRYGGILDKDAKSVNRGFII